MCVVSVRAILARGMRQGRSYSRKRPRLPLEPGFREGRCFRRKTPVVPYGKRQAAVPSFSGYPCEPFPESHNRLKRLFYPPNRARRLQFN